MTSLWALVLLAQIVWEPEVPPSPEASTESAGRADAPPSAAQDPRAGAIVFEPESATEAPPWREEHAEAAMVRARIRARTAVDTGWELGGEDVLDQRLRAELSYEQRMSRTLRVKIGAVASHFLTARAPAEGGRKADLDLDVGEAWVEVALGSMDVRIGNQVFTWGAARAFAPDDVLNPVDARGDAFLAPEDIKLPVLAASARGGAGGVAWEVVLVPFFRPHRMNLFGQDWSLLGPAQGALAFPVPDLGFVDRSVEDGLQAFLLGTVQPEEGLTPPSAGARVEWTALGGVWTGGLEREVKLALAYYEGYDRLPRLTIDPDLQEILAARAENRAPDLVKALRLADKVQSGLAVWRASYGWMRLFGLEASAMAGPVTLTLDAAYVPRKRQYTDTLLPVRFPTLTITLGATWERSDALVEVGATAPVVCELAAGQRLYLLDAPSDGGEARPWAAYPYLTLGGGAVFLDGDLRLGVGGVAGVRRGDRALTARVEYRLSDAWSAAAGATALWGPADSPLGYYSRNDAAFVELGWRM